MPRPSLLFAIIFIIIVGMILTTSSPSPSSCSSSSASSLVSAQQVTPTNNNMIELSLDFPKDPERSTYTTKSDHILYGRTINDLEFYHICYQEYAGQENSDRVVNATALCDMMGLNSSGAFVHYQFTTAQYLAIGGLKCWYKEDNNGVPDFAQCSYTKQNVSCDDRMYPGWYTYLELYCGSVTRKGGSRGRYLGGRRTTEQPDQNQISDTTSRKDYFIRGRENGQVQLREIFTTTWKNIAASSSSDFSFNVASRLCIGAFDNFDWYAWKYMRYAVSSFSTSHVYDATNGFMMKDLSCKSHFPTRFGDCSYSSDSLSDLPASKAIAVTCEVAKVLSSARGVPIGESYYLRLPIISDDRYNYRIEIVDMSSSRNNGSSNIQTYYGQSICRYAGSDGWSDGIDANAASALCRWAGYGPFAAGMIGAQVAWGATPIWKSISCPLGASSISDCTTVKLRDGEYCPNSWVTAVTCSQGTAPAPAAGSSGKGPIFWFGIAGGAAVVLIIIVLAVGAYLMHTRRRPGSSHHTTSSSSVTAEYADTMMTSVPLATVGEINDAPVPPPPSTPYRNLEDDDENGDLSMAHVQFNNPGTTHHQQQGPQVSGPFRFNF